MAADSTTTASVLTTEEVHAVLTEPLLAQSVVLASGPQIVDSAEPVRFPAITVYDINADNAASVAGPAWVGENEEITEQDPEWDEVVVLPRDRKSIKVIHRFSNELARQSVVNVGSALQTALVRRVALALDAAFINGSGADDTITGILNVPGVDTSLSGIGSPTVDDLHDAVGVALANDAQPNTWIMNPSTFIKLRKTKETGTGAYILQPDPQVANRFVLVGIPVAVSTQVPASKAILMDSRQVAIVRDLAPSVRFLTERYAEFDQVGIRVVARYDLGVLNPAAVVVLSGIS